MLCVLFATTHSPPACVLNWSHMKDNVYHLNDNVTEGLKLSAVIKLIELVSRGAALGVFICILYTVSALACVNEV